MRVGTGYDVHKFSAGRALILGGVKIPYKRGLIGHSDADVIVHAIIDALLGASAMGDIGQHFPDTESKYEGISSISLLEKTGALLEENNYIISNIDSTIIAQEPKMAPYIYQMRQNVALALHIGIDQVSIKASTEEGLGFTGRGEGIAAQAICVLEDLRDLIADSKMRFPSSGCALCPRWRTPLP